MTFEDEWEVPFKSGGAAGAVWRWAWGNVVCVSARPRGQRGSVAVGCPADHCGRTFALLDPDGKADCPVLVAWVGGGRERVTRLVEGRGPEHMTEGYGVGTFPLTRGARAPDELWFRLVCPEHGDLDMSASALWGARDDGARWVAARIHRSRKTLP